MTLEELVDKFRTVADAYNGIETFMFDDLSAINTDRKKKYPCLLLKVPATSSITPFKVSANEGNYENYNITFYLLTTWGVKEQKTISLEKKFTEIDTLANGYLKTLLQDGGNVYSMVNEKSVTKARGHHQHVDQLVGVSYTFTLRIFSCG